MRRSTIQWQVSNLSSSASSHQPAFDSNFAPQFPLFAPLVILAISSQSPDPLNALASLHEASTTSPAFSQRPYMDPNVLRYYVLLHDVGKSGEDLTELVQPGFNPILVICANFFSAFLSFSFHLKGRYLYSRVSRKPMVCTAVFFKSTRTWILLSLQRLLIYLAFGAKLSSQEVTLELRVAIQIRKARIYLNMEGSCRRKMSRGCEVSSENWLPRVSFLSWRDACSNGMSR